MMTRPSHFVYLDEADRFAPDVTAFLTLPPEKASLLQQPHGH